VDLKDVIEFMTPSLLPSAEDKDLPISKDAWALEDTSISFESSVLVLTAASTAENVASCDTVWVVSRGFMGSWYFISVIKSFRKLLKLPVSLFDI